MASLYDKTWPVNFAEQKTLASRILDKAKNICARTESIFLRQLTEPTQQEWETAYVAQSGGLLPIPVGVRLIWMDLTRGDCKAYTTTLDGFGGLSSLGSIHKMLDNTWTRPSIRLIGYCNSTRFTGRSTSVGQYLDWIPAYFSKNDINVFLNQNETYDWAKKGLDSIYIMYKLRSTAAVNIKLRLFFTGNDWFEDNGGSSELNGAFAEYTLAANTFAATDTAPGETNIGNALTNSLSLANAWSQGILFLHNIGQRLNEVGGVLTPVDDDVAPSMVGLGSYVGTGLTTSQYALEVGTGQKIDEYHQRISQMAVGSSDSNLSTTILSGEVWLYGLFKTTTGDL